MNPAAASSRTIRARIHESAVKRVTRAYGGRIADIFLEALQNSRRAGATRVRIAVGPAPPQCAETGDVQFTVTISDDGAGIADPAVLLSFGENGWDEALVRREDAAGFGFASLARRGCTVSSRPRLPDGEVPPGRRVELAPEHFLGEADAEVRADDGLPRTGSGAVPFPHGTAISFRATESAATIRSAAETAAQHYPLPVVFETRADGEPAGAEQLPRRAFLDGAVHAEAWRGLAFGVFKGGRRGYNDPDLNFFGLTLPVRLPSVATVHGPAWTVRADVHDCPDLELVLPARREAVENAFLAEMREAARLAVYRAMAADPAPRPAFADRERARQAGIEIAPPPAVLRPWRPPVAEADYWREPPKLAQAGHHACPGALVMACDPEPPEGQALWRAAERAGIASRLFEADRRLEGYGWYDALDRVTDLSFQAAADGAWMAIEDYPLPERPGPRAAALPARPAALRIELAVRPAAGHPGTLDLPADMAFAGEAWSWLDEALPLVTMDSALRPHELAGLLRAGFFSPSDDADSDSWETQRDRFDEAALHLATRLLLSDDEACRSSLAEAVRRELLWLCPRARTVDIRIRRPDVAVTLADPGPAP
ncbi:MAG: sensor histidine kinase [Rhodospirillaceae bacterium]|nr:sensor histidine kinase [Rhodospirillaceae bacterium]